jgi:hypothetical protein
LDWLEVEPVSIERNVTELLKDYLDKREDEEAKGITLANLMHLVQQTQQDNKQLKSTVILHGLRLDRHGQEIRGVKAILRQKGIHDDGVAEVDTGQYQIADLQRLLAESHAAKEKATLAINMQREADERERENAQWWRRSTVTWVMGGIGALVIAAISGGAAYIFASLSAGARQTGTGK